MPSRLGKRKTTNVPPATCSSFFAKFKNGILKFQKNLKLNLDTNNVEIYKRAKFQLEVPYNMGFAKIKI
jgi:hypothetical protein